MNENPIAKDKIKRENTHLGIVQPVTQPLEPSVERSPPRTRKKDMRGSKEKRSRERGEKRKEEKEPPPKHQQPIADYYSLSNKIIGQGSFSKVYLGLNNITHERVAIKVVKKVGDLKTQQMIKHESSILFQVDHPNIIKCHDLFENEDALYIVMELAVGGELFDRIVARDSYSEADAIKVMYQLFSAVAYLHSKGIVHRDLKPENLLLSKKKNDVGPIKISDFGLSKLYTDGMMSTVCGSPGYVSPEVLEGAGYGPGVDMWACGVIAYVLLCGYPPFYSEYQNILFESILNADYKFHSPYWDDISPGAKDLISMCLVVDPKKRITAEEALNHPWINLFKGPEEISDRMKAPLSSIMKHRLVETTQRNLITTSAVPSSKNNGFTKTM